MQVGIQPVSTPAACYFRPHPFHTSPEPQVEGLFLYLTLSQSSIPPEGCSEAHWNQEVERGEAENTWGTRTSVLRGQSWPVCRVFSHQLGAAEGSKWTHG